MRFTGQKLSSTLLLGTALALVFAAPDFALAQSSDDATERDGESTTLKPLIIESEAEPAHAPVNGYVATHSATG